MVERKSSRVFNMNYSYKIITEDSKLVIEEFLTGQIIAKHSLNKIIRIKNNPNHMCFQKESTLRVLKYLEWNYPEWLI